MSSTRATSEASAALRKLIATEFSAGAKLPAEKELAEQIGVSRNTLREALLSLWNEGLVTRRWGVGTFVRDGDEPVAQSLTTVVPLHQMFAGSGRDITQCATTIEQIPCPSEAASALSIEAGLTVWFVARTFAVDGQPAFHFENWLPLRIRKHAVDPRGLIDVGSDLLQWLQQTTHARITRLEAELRAVGAEGLAAEQLKVADGTHLILAKQVSVTDRGEILVYGHGYYQTDVLSLRLVRIPQL